MYTEEFPHTINVYDFEQVRMPGGGYEETPVLFGEITCFISPLTDEKTLQAMNMTDKSVFVLLMPYEYANGVTSDMEVEHNEYGMMKFNGPGKDLGGQREIMRYTLHLIE